MDNELVRLKEACDDALTNAANQSLPDACVNWGDLHCMYAERYEQDDGTKGFRVCIEEADPRNSSLHRFVAAELAKDGFHDVEIITEW